LQGKCSVAKVRCRMGAFWSALTLVELEKKPAIVSTAIRPGGLPRCTPQASPITYIPYLLMAACILVHLRSRRYRTATVRAPPNYIVRCVEGQCGRSLNLALRLSHQRADWCRLTRGARLPSIDCASTSQCKRVASLRAIALCFGAATSASLSIFSSTGRISPRKTPYGHKGTPLYYK